VTAELMRVLTAPVAEGRIISPSDRCDPQFAMEYATQLAGIALDMIPVAPPIGVRIGLEAHFLFALGSRLNPPSVRYQFYRWGVPWAELLFGCCASIAEADEPLVLPLALDLASWNAGVITQLVPSFVMAGPRTRHAHIPGRGAVDVVRLIHDCQIQHAGLLERSGDHEGAQQLREMAASLYREH